MDIANVGTPPKNREWKATCRNCGEKATATESEMDKIKYEKTPNGEKPFCWKTCPTCKKGPYGGLLFEPV